MRAHSAICIFIGLAAAFCVRTQARSPAEDSWKEFTSNEDAFVVSLPTMPELHSQDNEYDFGKVTIRSFQSKSKRGVNWRVATHNYPEPYASRMKPRKLIELMRDGMSANVKSKAEAIKEIKLDGYPGQEFVVRTPDPLTNKPLILKVRLIVVGSRVYQLMVVAPNDDNALAEEASKFFKSFALLKKKGVATK
jgi:hypothetical protein